MAQTIAWPYLCKTGYIPITAIKTELPIKVKVPLVDRKQT